MSWHLADPVLMNDILFKSGMNYSCATVEYYHLFQISNFLNAR